MFLKWERRIRVGSIKNGKGCKLVCSFCGMNSIPTHIVVGVTACCCCHFASIYLFGSATVQFRVKVVVTTSIAATSFCTILEPCFKKEKKSEK